MKTQQNIGRQKVLMIAVLCFAFAFTATAAFATLTFSSTAITTDSSLSLSGGNVGIGTTSPTKTLDVAGSANLSTGNAYYINGTSVLNTTTLGGGIVNSSLTSVGTLTDLTVTNPISGSVTGNAGTVTNGVYTNVANSFTLINPLTTIAESWIGPSSTTGIYFKGGNVGIGTTNPANAKLVVVKTGTGTQDALYLSNEQAVAADVGSALWFNGAPNSASSMARITTGWAGVATANGAYLTLSTRTDDGGQVEKMRITANGNIGIGTSIPDAKLRVVGNAIFGDTPENQIVTQAGVSYKIEATSNYNGDTGIIVNNPSTGTAARSAIFIGDNTSGHGFQIWQGGANNNQYTWAPLAAVISVESTMTNGLVFRTNGSHPFRFIQGTDVKMALVGGNLGIGTTAPGEKLEVNGAISTTGSWATHVANKGEMGFDSGNTYFLSYGPDVSTQGGFRFQTRNSSASLTTEAMSILGNGNVGITTTSPSGRLDIHGSGTTTGINTQWAGSDGVAKVSILDNGNVGIGTTSPIYKLDLLAPASTNGVFSEVTSDGYYAFASKNISSGNKEWGITVNGNDIRIRETGVDDRVTFRAGGNVGIGTTSPTAKLDINSDSFILETAKTPATAAAACTTGTIAWDASYTYVCVATNTWKRSALTTW